MASTDNPQAVIVEVGPRDGLQYESGFFPTEQKIELINRLSASGLKRIEVTSFVHPKIIPALRDAVEVLNGIRKAPGVVYSALVPNLKGCERALNTPADEIALFVSASEAHNQKNVGMSIAESLAGFEEIAKLALAAGRSLRGYVVTAFGCPYEGAIAEERVLSIAKSYADMGVAEVSLGDTTGMANPAMVREKMGRIAQELSQVRLAAHFHNSRGLGLANAYAAYQAGVHIFDSSVGGLGGCPTAVGAMGNVASEDLVNMLEEMGIDTGVDFAKLLEATALIQEVLDTQPASFTSRQGRPVWESAESKGQPDNCSC
ncbi:MAG: hydroxymethylglutaryl-CoA lyase [Deltaproteobacteria bacterium]|nr:hydroxymethylglutaryl-CoA lyase [Deltaproteobacteria bacterium]